MTDTFPRQYARTQRLTLGEPRNVSVTSDGRRVLFARSTAGNDPVNRLWSLDIDSGAEQLLADPATLLSVDDHELPPEERARRERLREGAGGITSFATSSDSNVVAFSLAGQLYVVVDGNPLHLDVPGPVFDPLPAPDGSRIAYVRGDALWVTDLNGAATKVASEPGDTVSWGSAEFIAAEEMGRYRGFWWSPDSDALAVCRVDVAPVQVWHLADPAAPSAAPSPNRYPAAGTPNAEVSLHIVPLRSDPEAAATADETVDDAADETVDVAIDHGELPYLAGVSWTEHGLTATLQSRDQRRLDVVEVDPTTGDTTVVWSDTDDDWVELVPGTGGLVAPGVLVMCADRDGARRLLLGDDAVSPADVQVRSVIAASATRTIVTGNPLADATVQHVYQWVNGEFTALTDGPGVHTAAAGGDTVLIRSASMLEPGGRWRLPDGVTIAGFAERPLVRPNVMLVTRGAADRDAVLLPHDHDGTPLPVLLDPYGGPHAQRVVQSHNAFCASQWFADQGFAVVIADGRGTPGRGSRYERAVRDDLASGVLDDQVAALEHAATRHPELDLTRVAIRGWSFGGYLAALAVLDRPDVFHAAIAGAPVTEWRLYDTHYTERYLGDPNEQPHVYDASSLLPRAPQLSRPLLLIHGLADDNVVAAHTLQLSSALLAAGKPHEVLPLVGVTHMTPQETVAENLLLHQLDFLRRSLREPTTH